MRAARRIPFFQEGYLQLIAPKLAATFFVILNFREEAKLLTYLEDFSSEERRERFTSVLRIRTKYITWTVEDAFQMHNASAVIHGCDVFGIQEAHLIANRNANGLDRNSAMDTQQ